MVLPLEQKAVRGLPVPAVRIGKLFHQFGRTRRAQIRLQIALPQRMVGNDAINTSERIALEEIDLLANLFGNRFRRLDHLAVDVGHIKIAVRRIGEVAGPEPDVGRCQELHLLLGAMRGERRAIGPDDVAVNQVAAHIAGEDAAGILLGKRVAIVDRAAGRGREPAAHLLGDVRSCSRCSAAGAAQCAACAIAAVRSADTSAPEGRP